MSNPSFSNIDLWLFELAEGNLTPEQVEQLELFLLQHPELDVERDMWQMARMEKEQHAYPETSSLQRKRRPGVWIGSAAVLLLLLLLGSYFMFDFNFETPVAGTSQSNELQAELSQMKKELAEKDASIKELKNRLKEEGVNLEEFELSNSLESKFDFSRYFLLPIISSEHLIATMNGLSGSYFLLNPQITYNSEPIYIAQNEEGS